MSSDPDITAIERKVAAGERLDQRDGEALFATTDLHTLGALAHVARTQRHGNVAYYNVNRHINYTNVCVLRCRFCGFRRTPADSDAYTLTVEQIVEQARQAASAGATEVHVVGGLHPSLPFDYYLDAVRAIRAACPALHIKAFTAIEIVHFARLAGTTIEGVLEALVAAGLDSLPGGGAEVFSERVHAETFNYRGKASADWFAVHRAAHAMHLPTNATMLYGHVETPAERVAHMIQLRTLQDEAPGFQAFVPLSFIPAGSQLSHLPGPTGVDDLRTVAVARLMLDNIPHIKAFWVMTGAKLSQVALHFGADDLDGTVVTYDITHREGAGKRQEMTVEQIETLIRQADLVPVERDSLYQPVRRD
ncbi:MAG: aminofutalosine synthase MqnE [Phycisphaerae bacterium]|nr:aminofutalosine synthase MqnE [Phycisphaerae bacterium]